MIITVQEDRSGRLDVFLTGELTELSRSRIQSLLKDGHILLNGKPARAKTPVTPGDSITVALPEPRPTEILPQDIPLHILHEDDDLAVINKPVGLVVHPAPGNSDRTLVNALIAHCGDSLAGIGGEKRPGIVHRLDKETSGGMVAAKTAATHANLVAQFSARSVDRAYHAIVWGMPEPGAGEIEGAIGRHPKNRKKMAVRENGGKYALTRYKTLSVYGGGLASFIECRLATGRTHQIRVHLSHRGHPLLGDPKYGRTSARREAVSRLDPDTKARLGAFSRQALHAHRLGFTHPKTCQHIDFTTALPSSMGELKKILEAL